MFYDRFIDLCKQHEIAPSALTKRLGMSSSAPGRWKTGSSPDLETAAKIADFFGVSIDFLIGREILGKQQATASEHSFILQNNYGNNTVAQGDLRTVGEQFSDMELELLRIFRNLDMRKKNSALSYLYDLEDGGKEG